MVTMCSSGMAPRWIWVAAVVRRALPGRWQCTRRVSLIEQRASPEPAAEGVGEDQGPGVRVGEGMDPEPVLRRRRQVLGRRPVVPTSDPGEVGVEVWRRPPSTRRWRLVTMIPGVVMPSRRSTSPLAHPASRHPVDNQSVTVTLWVESDS